MPIKKGDLVEYMDYPVFHFPPKDKKDVKYGISLENKDNVSNIRVRTAHGEDIAKHIYSYAWAGWIPEELEKIYEEEFLFSANDTDWDDY
jgi:hypothetical protein